MIPPSVVPPDRARKYPFPNFIPTRQPIPKDFELWPDLAFPDLKGATLPTTPPIPPVVQTGDIITATHENTVTTSLNDLWTNEQYIAAHMLSDPTTQLGDLLVRGAAVISRLPVGIDGQVLAADHAQTLGMKWINFNASTIGAVPTTTKIIPGAGISGGGALTGDVTLSANVLSVFGRTGAVVLTNADITGAGGVPTSRQFIAGTGLSGGGDMLADRTFNVVDNTTTQKVRVSSGGTLIGTHREVNFISGANVTISVTDNPGSDRTDVSIASTGGGGGMVDPTTSKGDLITRTSSALTRLPVSPTDGWVLTADSAQPTGLKWAAASGGGGGSQTPWTSDIDAAGFTLKSTGKIGVGNTGAVLPDANLGISHVIVGSTTTKNMGEVTVAVAGADPTAAGAFAFANYANAATEKRIAAMGAATDGAANSGALSFYVWQAGAMKTPLTIRANGNIGINNANPAYALDVAGDLNITGTFRVNGAPIGGGSGNQTPWTSDINAAGYSLNSAGHIGIGVTSGTAAITESLTATSELALFATQTVATLRARVSLANAGGDIADFGIYGASTSPPSFQRHAVVLSTNDLIFASGAMAERARITATGRLGINNAIPSRLIHVVGSSTASSANQIAISGYQAAFEVLNAANTQNYFMGIDDADGAKFKIGIGSSVAQGLIPTITMTPGQPGLVGIGTTSPGALLHLQYSSWNLLRLSTTLSTNNHIQVRFSAATPGDMWAMGTDNVFANGSKDFAIYDLIGNKATLLLQSSTGNVGIGLTSPARRLEVASDGSNWAGATFSGNGGTDKVAIGNFSNCATIAGNSAALNATANLSLNPGGGKVGINTTVIGSPLHIGGDATQNTPQGAITLSRIWNSATDTRASAIFHYYSAISGDDTLAFAVSGDAGGYNQPAQLSQIRMLIRSNGFVGIGTSNPQGPLHVAGPNYQIRAYLSTSNQNVVIQRVSGLGIIQSQTDGVGYDPLTINGNGGNVGIGNTVNPQAALHVCGVNGSAPNVTQDMGVANFQNQSNAQLSIIIDNTGICSLQTKNFTNNGTTYPLLLLPVNGNVGVGGWISPGYKLHVALDSAAKPGSSTWTVPSDLRFKENVQPVEDDSVALLRALQWIRYQYNGKGQTPKGHKSIGMDAKELQKIMPDAVRVTRGKMEMGDLKDSDLYAIDYHAVFVHAARAIQLLDERLRKAGL